MSRAAKRLRVFAGPNGSGKSTIVSAFRRTRIPLGIYVNADDLLQALTAGELLLSDYAANADFDALRRFHEESGQARSCGFPFLRGGAPLSVRLDRRVPDDTLSYSIAALADYLRHCLLAARLDFAFETVFSHPSK